jgi:hypothetical protein
MVRVIRVNLNSTEEDLGKWVGVIGEDDHFQLWRYDEKLVIELKRIPKESIAELRVR